MLICWQVRVLLYENWPCVYHWLYLVFSFKGIDWQCRCHTHNTLMLMKMALLLLLLIQYITVSYGRRWEKMCFPWCHSEACLSYKKKLQMPKGLSSVGLSHHCVNSFGDRLCLYRHLVTWKSLSHFKENIVVRACCSMAPTTGRLWLLGTESYKVEFPLAWSIDDSKNSIKQNVLNTWLSTLQKDRFEFNSFFKFMIR